jgi:hypothetical protein
MRSLDIYAFEKVKIPTLLSWSDEIPKNAMGKVNKKGMVLLFKDR